MPLLEHHIRNLLPLLLGGIDTSRIMRTRMQQKYRALRSTREGAKEASVIESNRAWVVVGIVDRGDTNVFEDGVMVC